MHLPVREQQLRALPSVILILYTQYAVSKSSGVKWEIHQQQITEHCCSRSMTLVVHAAPGSSTAGLVDFKFGPKLCTHSSCFEDQRGSMYRTAFVAVVMVPQNVKFSRIFRTVNDNRNHRSSQCYVQNGLELGCGECAEKLLRAGLAGILLLAR